MVFAVVAVLARLLSLLAGFWTDVGTCWADDGAGAVVAGCGLGLGGGGGGRATGRAAAGGALT